MKIDLQQATVPITAVVALVVAGLGYWVNAQEADVEALEEHVDRVASEVQKQKLDVVETLGAIKTQQALDSQKVEQVLEALRDIRTELRDPE